MMAGAGIRHLFWIGLSIAFACSPGWAQEGDAAGAKPETPDLKGDERIWGLILYAHSSKDEPVEPVPKMERFHPDSLKSVMTKVGKALPKYDKFKVVGAHDQKVLKEYATWITPSSEFFLEVDSKGRAKEGDGIKIYLQLWNRQREGDGKSKGKVLVKSDAVLKRSSPLIIEGPKWREGRIVFVLVLEYTELLKKEEG